MHRAGFYHRDLHGNNIMCLHRANGGVKALFVDLHEGVWLPRLPRRWAIRDLARLNGSLRTRLAARYRFLTRYLQQRRITGPGVQKRWATEIEHYTRALWRRSLDRHGVDRQQYGPPV